MKTGILCISLSLALVFPFGCQGRRQPGLRPLGPDAVILAFGDSITYGTGAGPGEDYPSRLAGISGLEVVNSGVPGEETQEGLARLPNVLEDVSPDLVILCHGGNDILHGRPDTAIEENLALMVEAVRASGADVVIVAVPFFSFGLHDAPFYRKVAERFSIPCLDGVLADILAKEGLKSDTVHPNARGYAVLAEEIADLLREAGALQ